MFLNSKKKKNGKSKIRENWRKIMLMRLRILSGVISCFFILLSHCQTVSGFSFQAEFSYNVICFNTIRSSTVSSEDAALYLQRYRKKMEVINSKLAKDRKRQEQKLHQKLTALKQKKIEEKVLMHVTETAVKRPFCFVCLLSLFLKVHFLFTRT